LQSSVSQKAGVERDVAVLATRGAWMMFLDLQVVSMARILGARSSCAGALCRAEQDSVAALVWIGAVWVVVGGAHWVIGPWRSSRCMMHMVRGFAA